MCGLLPCRDAVNIKYYHVRWACSKYSALVLMVFTVVITLTFSSPLSPSALLSLSSLTSSSSSWLSSCHIIIIVTINLFFIFMLLPVRVSFPLTILLPFWDDRGWRKCWTLSMNSQLSLSQVTSPRKTFLGLSVQGWRLFLLQVVILVINQDEGNCQELWKVYLQVNKMVCHCFMDAGRRHKTPGSERKDNLLTQSNSGSQRIHTDTSSLNPNS
jgi:hypothetical protein